MCTLITTERLLIREFTMEDAPFIFELLNSPGWIKFIGDRNIKKLEDAKQYLENVPLKSYRYNGFGLWNVLLKDTQTPIGMCGIIKRDSLEHPDIGYAFLPQFTGNGYAVESASAVVRYAKSKLYMQKLYAITGTQNERSQKVLKSIGFQYLKTFMEDEERETMLFSI